MEYGNAGRDYLETKKSLPQWKKVFKLEFEYGEFDMVIHDEKELTCEIFEIKKQYMVEKTWIFGCRSAPGSRFYGIFRTLKLSCPWQAWAGGQFINW